MDISRARADEWRFLVGEADCGPSITEYPGFPQIHEVILSGYRLCDAISTCPLLYDQCS